MKNRNGYMEIIREDDEYIILEERGIEIGFGVSTSFFDFFIPVVRGGRKYVKIPTRFIMAIAAIPGVKLSIDLKSGTMNIESLDDRLNLLGEYNTISPDIRKSLPRSSHHMVSVKNFQIPGCKHLLHYQDTDKCEEPSRSPISYKLADYINSLN